jgi:hypothetical protein
MANRAPIFLLLVSFGAADSQTTTGLYCSASAPAFPYVNAEGIAEQTGDILITCSGGYPTPAGVAVPAVTITVALNTQVTSRTPDGVITDALLLIDEPGSGTGSLTPAFCPSVAGMYGCSTTVTGGGMGGGQNASPSTYATANIFQGVLTALNTVTFFNVPIDPPGTAFSVQPLKLRITNIRANASALGYSSGAPSEVTGFVSTSAGFQLDNPSVPIANVVSGLTGRVVTNDAQIPICSAGPLQPAFIVSVTEGFPSSWRTQFPSPTSLAYLPGNTELATSGYLVTGLPLTTASPGVADFGTRIKLTFGNTDPGVTLYVPVSINATVAPPAAMPTLTATLTASESGPFSAVPATNGTLAAVTNGVAIYEVVSEQPVSLTSLETLSIPVSQSFSTTASSVSPLTSTVMVDFAPSPLAPGYGWTNPSSGPIPRYLQFSPTLTSYSITQCPVSTFSAYAGTPQSATINTAYSAPLQVLLKDSNNNPLSGSNVTFSLPAAGPGAVFAGGGTTATVSTNSQGIATSPQVIANSTAGTFTASASPAIASSLTANFTLTNVPVTPVITFAPISTHYVGDLPFALTATSNVSPAPIVFTVLSGPATLTGTITGRVDGSLVTVTGTGTVVIEASQPATASYTSATATQSFTVASGPSPEITCTLSAPAPLEAHAEGLAELVGDVVLICKGGVATPLNSPVPTTNIVVNLNTQVTSRLLGGSSNITDALLLINEPVASAQKLCPADPANQYSCDTTVLGTGGGGAAGASPLQYTNANIYQGVLTSSNQLTFFNVPIDGPGPSAYAPLTFRITNVRANASAIGAPVGFNESLVTESISASSPLVFISNPTQSPAYILSGLQNRSVTNTAQFSQCSAQTLQPAFSVSAQEGYASSFDPRFAATIANESIPGNAIYATSGFLISGFPLVITSPGVADFATRVKFTFLNTSPGVTLYVPTSITISPNPGDTLTAALTSSETGAFSAVPASAGTGGLLAAVTNNVAVYEFTSVSSVAANAIDTLTLPVYISYSGSPGTYPAAGTGMVQVDFAPTSTLVTASAGPIPRFAAVSPTLSTYTISQCTVTTFAPYSGTPQNAVTGTAFAAPLQAIAKDANSNPVSGVTVTFTAPSSGASGSFQGVSGCSSPCTSATVTTNSSGIATAPGLVANGTSGTYTVTATSASAPGSLSFTLTNLASTPSSVSVTPSAASGTSQVFTAVYSDTAGASALAGELFLINSGINGGGACYVQIYSGGIYLVNDVGSGVGGPLTGSGTLSNSQCTLNGAGSGVTSAGNNVTATISITFKSSFAGAKSIYMYTADATANTGWQARGTYSVTSLPAAVSVSPSTASGTSQVFTAVYSDTAGASALAGELFLINAGINGVGACYVQVYSGGIYLVSDVGSWVSGPLTGSGTLSNSQCTLNGAGSGVTSAGNNVTATISITFNSSFAGAKSIYMYTADSTANTGWQARGTYTISSVPTAVSVSPNAASGTSQVFTAVYSDTAGATALAGELFLINSGINGVGACYIQIYPGGIYLVNDAGSGVGGPLTGSGTLSNSQCTLNGAGSGVVSAGNNITATISIAFNSSFAGAKSIYMYTADSMTNTGWQARGTYTVTSVPAAVSVNPSAASGTSQVFTAVYSDTAGAGALAGELFLINAGINGVGACYVQVYSGGIYLVNDAGSGVAGPLTGSGTLSNSQCTLNGTGSGVTSAGNNVTATISITFKSSFAGAKSIYMYTADSTANTGWQARGTYTVTSVPAAVSVSPSAASGTSQVFTAVYSDTAGANALGGELFLINSGINGGGACYVQIYSGGIYLVNDAGSAVIGPLTGSGTLSNSQCTLNGAGSSVTSAGNNLTATISITFNNSFAGAKSVYMYTADSTANTGWQTKGTFTVN